MITIITYSCDKHLGLRPKPTLWHGASEKIKEYDGFQLCALDGCSDSATRKVNCYLEDYELPGGQ